tara:strand:- start:179248 stop:180990 length:1743 start_codon:yes stop_codon:yes gene_type:complete
MSDKSKNPYQSLPDDKFWKMGVQSRQAHGYYENIWQPKFKIKKKSKIVAAGSCFAQHVGKWLSKKGFSFLPSTLDTEHNFSFAFGNIYSTALLRQWLEAALAQKDLSNIYHEEEGRFYDLLRPAFMADGFKSKKALIKSRTDALKEMYAQISQADVFVFTLGLTESWNDVDGVVYPMCPGTLCGEFDNEKHFFKNYDVAENMEEMTKAIELVREINANVKFLLTVSPVPLTATASENHVLTATCLSKSVLRIVAGMLTSQNPDIDYFPSYEIITTHANKGRFFKDNMRDVTEEGVSHVMAHLEAVMLPYEFKKAKKKERLEAEMLEQHLVQADDVACEEMVLETLRNKYQSIEASRFILIGDSHMGRISKCLAQKGIPHSGGAFMDASSWDKGLFHLDDDEYMVLLDGREGRNRWIDTLENLRVSEMKTGKKPIILTNVGFQTNRSAIRLMRWMDETGGNSNIDPKLAVKFFDQVYDKQVGFLNRLKEAGLEVLVISDPPIHHLDESMRDHDAYIRFYEKIFEIVLKKNGIKLFNAREWREKGKGFAKDSHIFLDGSPDWVHGSETYYEELTDKLLSKYK